MILPMFSHPCSDGYVFQWGNTDQFRHSESIIRKHRFRGHGRRDSRFYGTKNLLKGMSKILFWRLTSISSYH